MEDHIIEQAVGFGARERRKRLNMMKRVLRGTREADMHYHFYRGMLPEVHIQAEAEVAAEAAAALLPPAPAPVIIIDDGPEIYIPPEALAEENEDIRAARESDRIEERRREMMREVVERLRRRRERRE